MTTPLLGAPEQTTPDVPNADVPNSDAPSTARLVPHVVALFVVLLALIPILGGNGLFSADEGAGILQTKVLAETGQWRLDHPLPEVDPTGEHFSLHLSVGNDDGYVLISRKPAYTLLLAGLWKIVPSPMMLMALSALGATMAAWGSALLSRAFRPDIDVVVLWGVGLLSPLAFDSQLIIAHALGAGFAAFAAVFLLRASDGWPSVRNLLAACVMLAMLVSTRTEGIIAALALCGAVGLVGALRRNSGSVLVGVVGIAASVVAYLADRAAAATIQGEALIGVNGTNVSTPRARSLDGQIEGFNRTWLWARTGGIAPSDYLLVLAIALIAIALVLARRSHLHDIASKLAIAGAVLGVTKFLADPSVVIPGLLFAFPLMVFGFVTLRAAHTRSSGSVLLIAFAVFCLGVAATQYREGGSAEFGGRYFALGIPFIAPLLFAAVGDRLAALTEASRRRIVVAIVLVSVSTIGSGLVGLWSSQHHSADLVDAIEETMVDLEAATGEPAVILTTQNPVGRFVWEQQDQGVVLLLPADELLEFAGRLQRNGTDRFGLVTIDPEGDIAALPGATVLRDREAWPDSRWHVVTIDAS